ncbi:MAG: DUF350 domain-containing protein [Saezia sp.]
MTITLTLAQFTNYLTYLSASLLMIVTFIFAYLYITPIKEIKLIREGCIAAALSFGGALIGLCLTLASSIKNADNLISFIIWGVCAAVIQLLVYFAITKLVPNARLELEDNNIAVGGLFCTISLAIGIVNAACLT